MLTVSQLIEQLKQMPQDLPVCKFVPDYHYCLVGSPQVVKVQKDSWGDFNEPREDDTPDTLMDAVCLGLNAEECHRNGW